MGTRIFVGNIPYNITDELLISELACLGHPPMSVKVIKDRETGNGRGFAFADYVSDAAASKALAGLNGCVVGGRPLRVDAASEKPGGGGGGGGGGRPQGRPSGGSFEPGRGRQAGGGGGKHEDVWREDRRRGNKRGQW